MLLLTSLTTSRRRVLLAWLPPILWLLVIACESTGTFSSNHTFVWTRRLLQLFSDHFTFSQVELVNHILRKTGHFVGYATLSWLIFRGSMETLAYRKERFLMRLGRPLKGERRWRLRAAVFAVFCTFVIAGLDEFHQSYLPERTGVFRDVILDTMGGIFAQTLLLVYWINRKPARVPAKATAALEATSSN
jgi:VanZ family protein